MSTNTTLLLLLIDQALESYLPSEREHFALEVEKRTQKYIASSSPPVVASPPSAVDDELRDEPVRVVAAFLKICDESARKLVRRNELVRVPKGLGRNYNVLWSSVLAYKRRMVGSNGNAQAEQDSEAMASKVARRR